jgi:thiol:disulfide interchange protein DsbA
MPRLKTIAAVFALSAAFISAHASPSAPRAGADYTAVTPPQPVQASGKKIEVIEFFMYHCPACYSLEPALAEWVKQQGDNIQFRRIHVPHTGNDDPEAHLFLALDALQRENALHDKVEATWHVEHHRLSSDADNLDWAVKNGIDKAQFLSVYNSFSVLAKLKNLGRMAENYGVDSTPTLVVDGRYLTNPAMIGGANADLTRENVDKATMEVLDKLVATARKAHGDAPAK